MEDVERIFNESNKEEYLDTLKRHNILSDIYFDGDFLKADATLQQGEYEVYFLENDGNYFIYPYIKVPFNFNNDTVYDLISPYGYSGPISNDKLFFNHAEIRFVEYVRAKGNVITEFVRYHYLYGAEQKFAVDIDNEKNRDIVTLDLQNSWESLFKNCFSPTARNLIRKMENQGYTFHIDMDYKDMDNFISLYYENMKYAVATDFYYFPRKFFYELKDNLQGRMVLAHVKKDEQIYCSSLFFLHSGIVTYYLSGRDVKHSNVPSNYFILSSMIKWAVENDFTLFNFGGGRTTLEGDSLFKFKSHFSKKSVPYFTGKRVHNKVLLSAIKEDYIDKNGIEEFNKRSNFLQFYR